MVFGFDIGFDSVAVSEATLIEFGYVRVDTSKGFVDVTRSSDGHISARSSTHLETSPARRMFWFAWYTFNPDTKLADSSIADSFGHCAT